MKTDNKYLSENELQNILDEYEKANIKFGVHQYNVDTGYIHYGHCVHRIENAFYVLLQNIKFFNKAGYRYYFAPQPIQNNDSKIGEDEQEFWRQFSWEIEKSYVANNYLSIS